MKTILHGKRYDTTKAVPVARLANTGTWSDPAHCEEALYRKKNGEYFLHGEGGPASLYGRKAGENTFSGGEAIRPMTYAEARAWATARLSADEFSAAFSGDAAGDALIPINAAIRASLFAKLRNLASSEGTSIKAVLERLIEKA